MSCCNVGILTLGLITLFAATVSGQSCPSGKASADANGVGNDESKADLSAPSTGCSDFISSLGVGTAREDQLGATVVVSIEFDCANGTADETESIAYDSDYETENVPSPPNGFNTLSGTYDGAGVTSIEGVGKASGTAPAALL